MYFIQNFIDPCNQPGLNDTGKTKERDMGRVVPEFDQPFLRELIHLPFRVVYRRDPRRVRIVRVWRSERRLHLPTDDQEGPSRT